MCLKINKSRRDFRSVEIELSSKNASRRFATNKQTGRIPTECHCG